MDVEKVFRMNEGTGEKSYAQNSSLQKKDIEMVQSTTIETIVDLYFTHFPETLRIADLGCSSGPNSLSVIKSIIESIGERCRRSLRPFPEFQVFLNDLPSNDFNSIFRSLSSFYEKLKQDKGGDCPLCFVSGVPGSFYGRLFPIQSLHFVHSSFSLHWLSQVPHALFDNKGESINKRNIYISEASSTLVSKAYSHQFQNDFSKFLKSRSEEMISGGRMVLILLGRRTTDPADKDSIFLWELLAQAFASMVSQGEIDQEKVDSFNVPFYAPCMEEIRAEVEREGSFKIDRLEFCETRRNIARGTGGGKIVAMAVRAIQESIIRHHFGEQILDGLFEKYGEILDKTEKDNSIDIFFTVSTTKYKVD